MADERQPETSIPGDPASDHADQPATQARLDEALVALAKARAATTESLEAVRRLDNSAALLEEIAARLGDLTVRSSVELSALGAEGRRLLFLAEELCALARRSAVAGRDAHAPLEAMRDRTRRTREALEAAEGTVRELHASANRPRGPQVVWENHTASVPDEALAAPSRARAGDGTQPRHPDALWLTLARRRTPRN